MRSRNSAKICRASPEGWLESMEPREHQGQTTYSSASLMKLPVATVSRPHH